MIPNAAPAVAAAHGWLSGLAARWVVAGNLHGPGRIAAAIGVVIGALVLGRVGSEVLAGAFRLALIVAAVLFAYQLLRA